MPAKAGIQRTGRGTARPGFPACAGMTAGSPGFRPMQSSPGACDDEACGPDRLRFRQSPLGGEGPGARRAGARHGTPDRRHRRRGRGRDGRADRAARRRRLRRLHERARRPAGHGRDAERARDPRRRAVPRHLRRHAIDGAGRTGVRRSSGAGLDRRRRRAHDARRSVAQDSADRLERAHVHRAPIPSPTVCRRMPTPISCTPTPMPARARRTSWRGRITADRSPPRSRATTWSACNSHPEKSQAVGLALLGNFLVWTP